jgi:hypothetical protein
MENSQLGEMVAGSLSSRKNSAAGCDLFRWPSTNNKKNQPRTAGQKEPIVMRHIECVAQKRNTKSCQLPGGTTRSKKKSPAESEANLLSAGGAT